MYEQIKERYEKGYITDVQLDRYVSLKVITNDQAEEIKTGVKPPQEDAVPTAELDAAYQEGVNSVE